MWTLVSYTFIINFGEFSAFLSCSLLFSSLPSYSFPWEAAPLLAWWLQRCSEGHKRIASRWLCFLPSDISVQKTCRKIGEKGPILYNLWGWGKSEFTSAPAFTLTEFPQCALETFTPHCKANVFFRLVNILLQKDQCTLMVTVSFSGLDQVKHQQGWMWKELRLVSPFREIVQNSGHNW